MDRKAFRRVAVIVLLVFISASFFAMIRPFLMTFLLAAIFSGLAYPLYERFRRWFRGRKALASTVTLLLVLVLIVGPLLFFLGILASEALRISEQVGPWIEKQMQEPDQLTRFLERVPGMDKIQPYREQIITKLGEFVQTIGTFMVNGLSAATRGTASFLFQFAILLYAMFFFLKDGPELIAKIMHYIPLSDADERRMLDKFVSVTRATLKGTLVIGVIQGSLAAIALGLAGVQSVVFWGTVMTVLSIIPGVGTALVWLPVAIFKVATGDVLTGVLLALFCGLLVGSVDNVLRPRLVGRDTKMPDLLIFLGTLGGIFLFGVVGFIIGPILAALFVTIWEIYGAVFKEVLGPDPASDIEV